MCYIIVYFLSLDSSQIFMMKKRPMTYMVFNYLINTSILVVFFANVIIIIV